MKKETKMKLAKSGKIIIGSLGFLIWINVIFTIANSKASFIEQAPYCMLSTMIISGVLTGIFKGLDYWGLEKQKSQEIS